MTRPIDYLKVKGKKIPVQVHELIGMSEDTPASEKEGAERFAKAFAFYLKRDFEQALGVLKQLAAGDPADELVALYIRRCEAYTVHPPPADWDGSYGMTSK